MFCRNCGKEVPDGNAFCEYCGTKVGVVNEVKPQNKKSKKPLIISLVSVVIVAVIVVVLVLVFSDDTPNIRPNTIPGAYSNDYGSNSNSGSTKTYAVTLNFNVDNNTRMAKYGIDVSINNTKLTTLSTGQRYSRTIDLAPGQYTILFESNQSEQSKNQSEGLLDGLLDKGASLLEEAVGVDNVSATVTIDVSKDMNVTYRINPNLRSLKVEKQ